jgi:predicted DsbA family dithiol-disulfide isomerase
MRRAFADVTKAGRPEGIRFDFDRVASAPNTVDAHRLILHAAARGRERPMSGALFRGYFAEGRDLNDPEDLTAMAADAGLDPDEVRTFLAGDSGTQDVWGSQQAAAAFGIGGVPLYVIDDRYAVPGGQPAEVWLRTLDAIEAEQVSWPPRRPRARRQDPSTRRLRYRWFLTTFVLAHVRSSLEMGSRRG